MKKKLRYRQEDNIKMKLEEIEFKDVECIFVAQDSVHIQALVNVVVSFWVPLKAENFLTSRLTGSILRKILFQGVISISNIYRHMNIVM
jgi:hypothetical protein